MKTAVVVGAIALGCPLLSSPFERNFETTVQGGAMRMDEWGLRASATNAPMPEYPRESLSRKSSGVVVAVVTSAKF